MVWKNIVDVRPKSFMIVLVDLACVLFWGKGNNDKNAEKDCERTAELFGSCCSELKRNSSNPEMIDLSSLSTTSFS